MRKAMLVGLIVIVGAALAWLWGAQKHRTSQHTSSSIRVSGTFELTDAEVSFKVAGRVERRLVDEGETVHTGQLVAVLDASEFKQQVALQRAELAAARAALNELLAGSRPEEIEQARAVSARADAVLAELKAGSRTEEIAASEAVLQRENAERDRLSLEARRYESLVSQEAVTVSARDLVQAQYKAAQARVAEANERLKLLKAGTRSEQIDQAAAAAAEARAKYELIKAGPRAETIEQARARVLQAHETVVLAETRLSYTEVVAPLNGVVLSKNVEPGEYVSPGTPVVTVGDLEHIWLRAYINETDLGRVKLGQAVSITTDTYPERSYAGQVAFIASQAEFTPKNVQTQQERVKLVYRTKINVANPRMELKPGMPADGVIELE